MEEVNALHLPLSFIAVLDRNVALKVSRKKKEEEKKTSIVAFILKPNSLLTLSTRICAMCE